MPISVACSTCGGKFKAPDSAAGKKAKCPKCGVALVVHLTGTSEHVAAPVPKVVAPPTAVMPSTPPAEAIAEVLPSRPPVDYKDCSFCGEQILATAKKCKHCGETIDILLRVAEEARRSSEKQNAMVFMNAGGGGAASSSSSSGGSPVVIVGSEKSVGVAIFLTVLFGPLGMFYSTVAGTLIMLVVSIVLAVNTLGLSILITWPICIIWAAAAASNHNARPRVRY